MPASGIMDVNDKKKEEIYILELFRDRYENFPKGKLIPGESPDFILSLGPKKKIGLELTRLHQHSPGKDPFSFENISACLQQKEDKLVLYRRKNLQAYWLILTIVDPAYKPRYNLYNKLIARDFSTSFDEIFLFNALSGDVFTLNRRHKG